MAISENNFSKLRINGCFLNIIYPNQRWFFPKKEQEANHLVLLLCAFVLNNLYSENLSNFHTS